MAYIGSALHDMIYVGAAAVVCLLSSWQVFHLMVKNKPSMSRTISIVVLAGLGVWATHFVAILGLRPDFLISYSIPETIGSMLLAIAVIGGGLALAGGASRLIPALGFASVAGGGISAMHHLGMLGLSGCIVAFDTTNLIFATLAAMMFSCLAVAVSRSFHRYRVVIATTLFVAGVVILHFGSVFGTTFQVGGEAVWVMSGPLLMICQIVAVLVILSPISTIVRQQIALSREATLSGQVAKATDEGVVTMDATGRLTWANDAFLRMTGFTRDQIHNANSVKVVEIIADLEDADAYRHAIETGGKTVIDVRVERRGATQRWQRVRLIPRRAEDGALVGFVSAHQDITAEKAALERLKASEAEASRLAIVAEHTADSILITDEVGHTTWVNESFVRLTGYSLEDMRGRRPGAVLQCRETNPETVREINNAIRTLTPIRTEILNAKKDGSTYWIGLEVSPVKRDGKPMQFIAISRDISVRIEREKRLEEARRKAETADRMKSEFLARMSHEIRTPMNGVTGLTEVLSTTDLTDDQSKYVALMRESSGQLMQVLNDVLDFSSIAKGEVALTSQPFDLQKVAEEALSEVSLTAKDRGIELNLQFDAASAHLQGDRNRLKQVILNLLSNAVKFTEEGSVTLKISPDDPSTDPGRGVQISFAVIDTGVGIPPEMHEHVFEPFRQVEESATRSYEGTGLGLTIARDIVTTMGGRLTVKSEVGTGSAFSFSLGFDVEGAQGSATEAA